MEDIRIETEMLALFDTIKFKLRLKNHLQDLLFIILCHICSDHFDKTLRDMLIKEYPLLKVIYMCWPKATEAQCNKFYERFLDLGISPILTILSDYASSINFDDALEAMDNDSCNEGVYLKNINILKDFYTINKHMSLCIVNNELAALELDSN